MPELVDRDAGFCGALEDAVDGGARVWRAEQIPQDGFRAPSVVFAGEDEPINALAASTGVGKATYTVRCYGTDEANSVALQQAIWDALNSKREVGGATWWLGSDVTGMRAFAEVDQQTGEVLARGRELTVVVMYRR